MAIRAARTRPFRVPRPGTFAARGHFCARSLRGGLAGDVIASRRHRIPGAEGDVRRLKCCSPVPHDPVSSILGMGGPVPSPKVIGDEQPRRIRRRGATMSAVSPVRAGSLHQIAPSRWTQSPLPVVTRDADLARPFMKAAVVRGRSSRVGRCIDTNWTSAWGK